MFRHCVVCFVYCLLDSSPQLKMWVIQPPWYALFFPLTHSHCTNTTQAPQITNFSEKDRVLGAIGEDIAKHWECKIDQGHRTCFIDEETGRHIPINRFRMNDWAAHIVCYQYSLCRQLSNCLASLLRKVLFLRTRNQGRHSICSLSGNKLPLQRLVVGLAPILP